MGTNWPQNWRLTVLKTISMMLIRPPYDQFQDDCQSSLRFAALNPLPPPIHPWNSPLKALALWLAVGSWLLDMSLPSTQVASLLNRANFPFQPTSVSQVLAFEQQPAKRELSSTFRELLLSVSDSQLCLHSCSLSIYFFLLTVESQSRVS